VTESNGSWATATPARLPADAGTPSFSYPAAVSCTSAGNCAAVGNYTTASGGAEGLLLTETNGAWASGTEALLPTDATRSTTRQSVTLSAVDCVSAGNCTAVGSYVDGSGSAQGLLLSETNGTWGAGTKALLPAAAARGPRRQFVQLASVSCPSAGNCTAVGTYVDNGNSRRGVFLRERGGTWTRGTEARLPADAAPDGLVNPSGHFNYGLNSVSCPTAGNCSVIGEYANRAGIEQGLLLNERTGAWARGVKIRLPANAATGASKMSSVLFSLSCTSTGNCVAVGWYVDQADRGDTLVVSERNGAWQRGIEPRLPANAGSRTVSGGDELESVACATAGNCTVVGAYSTGSKLEGLLLSERNGKWARATEVRLPPGATKAAYTVSDHDPGVFDVSCAAAGSCSAIGAYADGSAYPRALVINETAGAWARAIDARLP
jgi:hypothetical protein